MPFPGHCTTPKEDPELGVRIQLKTEGPPNWRHSAEHGKLDEALNVSWLGTPTAQKRPREAA